MVKLISLVYVLAVATIAAASYDCVGKKDGFYSDLEYCHIYWRCNYGAPEEYECPAGTAWNHKEGRCDWLDNVDCTRDGTMEDPNTTKTTKVPTTTENEEDLTLPPQFPDTTNASPDVTNIDGGVVFSTKTKPAEIRLAEIKLLNFQEEKNLTDQILDLLAENSLNLSSVALRLENFQDLNLTEVVKHLEAKSMNLTAEMALLANQTEELNLQLTITSENTTVITTTTEATTTTPKDFDEYCEELPGETGFMPDPTGCNKYIRCNHGKSQRFTCASGTVWDITNSMCLWSESVDCGDRKIEVEEKKKEIEKASDDYEYYSDEELEMMAAKEAMEKEATSTTKSSSPAPKEKAESLVDVTEAAETTKKSSVCQSQFGSYYVEDKTNCGAYFLCQNGKETKMTCKDKQLFNLETSMCADFQTVFCGMRPVNYADKNQCLSKRDGIYPDLERQCQVFYQCIKQEKVREASCPVPLKFNSVTGRCDNPVNILSPCGSYNPRFNSASSLLGFTNSLSVLITGLVAKFLVATL